MEKIITNYPNMDTSGMNNKQEILERLHSCKENYRQAVAKGKELRHEFLLEWAEIAASNNNQTLETAIKQLAYIEVSIQTFASIKRVMNPTTYQPGLTSIRVPIRVPTDKGSYRTVNDPKEIEDHLINRNLEHYAQAEHTAMAHHLICEKMGTSGSTDFCDRVLQGTADLSNIPTTLQSIFQQLHRLHTVDISLMITYDDFKDALAQWKETTSTSPSSHHLGHYMSVLKDIGDKTDEVADKILRLHHTMLQVAQYCCKPFTRWKIETEIMLEKDKGDPKIDRLHIICLYEADYNIFLKIMWAHRLVKIYKEHELFDDTQAGGRPNLRGRGGTKCSPTHTPGSQEHHSPAWIWTQNHATTGSWHHLACYVPGTLGCPKKHACYMERRYRKCATT
jgi:hypothetical protein